MFDTILVPGLCTSTSTVTNPVTVVLEVGIPTTIRSNFIAVDWPVAMEWEVKDLPFFTPKSAPVLARETAPSSSSSQSPSSGSTPKRPSASNTGYIVGHGSDGSLSAAAEAGIGFAVAIVALAFIGSLVWLMMRHREQRRGHNRTRGGVLQYQQGNYGGPFQKYELMAAGAERHEADSSAVCRAELEGN